MGSVVWDVGSEERLRRISTRMKGLTYAMAAVCLVGCTKNPSYNDYIETTKRGVTAVPHVREITAIFTNSPKSHFIEQLGLRAGSKPKPAKWNTIVWFGGRYEFTYQVDVNPRSPRAYNQKSECREILLSGSRRDHRQRQGSEIRSIRETRSSGKPNGRKFLRQEVISQSSVSC